MTMAPRGARGEAGFTLIELVISLGLFALIAVAGLAMLDSILGVQTRTEGRLDRLAEMQRALFVVTSDLDQVAPGRISGGGAMLSFTRAAPGGKGGPPVPMRYDLSDATLIRSAGPLPQILLPGVTAMRVRFFDQGWVDRWPVSDSDADAVRWPSAIEIDLQIATPGGLSGSLRRVVALPSKPDTTE